MVNINRNNINRIMEKYKSLYINMLNKHYKPLLTNYINELLQELNIEDYTIDYGFDDSTYIHLLIYNNSFQLNEIVEPYANKKYNNINHPHNKLFNYIESGQYNKEKKCYDKNK